MTPVHQPIDCEPPSPPPPRIRTTSHVHSAPAGAARLNAIRCARAWRLPSPCLSRTVVRPKAAGALCTMMAKKMTKESDGCADEAPSAMPSAAAWMTNPSVVEVAALAWVGGPGEDGELLASSARE